jgi:hypothetical protein
VTAAVQLVILEAVGVRDPTLEGGVIDPTLLVGEEVVLIGGKVIGVLIGVVVGVLGLDIITLNFFTGVIGGFINEALYLAIASVMILVVSDNSPSWDRC